MTDHLSHFPLVRAAGGVIGQVAVVVEDIRKGIESWGAADAEHTWRVWEYSPRTIPKQTYLGQPSEYSMLLGMNGANPQFELIQPLQGPSIYHTWLEEGRTGIHHLGFYVPDLLSVTAEMEEAGFACVLTGEGHGADGTGRFAYYDTREQLGFYIEGIEVPSQRREPMYVWPEEEANV